MRKGPRSAYDKWNISVVICDTDIPWIRTKLYDKKDDFNFPIVNFPFICSNIPAAPAYTNNDTLSEQFQYPRVNSWKEAKSISLTHKYMTAQIPGLIQAHYVFFKVAGLV
jgi:hypothetical protein